MANHDASIDELMRRFGLRPDQVNRIRLGNGVIGRSSTLALLVILVCGAGLFQLPGLWRLAPLALAVVVFLVFHIGSMLFAAKNPGVALLEGGELLHWKQLDQGARDLPIIPLDLPLIANPESGVPPKPHGEG